MSNELVKKEEKTQMIPEEKNITDNVLSKIQKFQANGQIYFPNNYSPENALKSAWLILQDVKDKDGNLALKSCTRDSIANSLLNMVIQGLNPMKNQCYFIPYGQKLTLMRSYFGSITVSPFILSEVKNAPACDSKISPFIILSSIKYASSKVKSFPSTTFPNISLISIFIPSYFKKLFNIFIPSFVIIDSG